MSPTRKIPPARLCRFVLGTDPDHRPTALIWARLRAADDGTLPELAALLAAEGVVL